MVCARISPVASTASTQIPASGSDALSATEPSTVGLVAKVASTPLTTASLLTITGSGYARLRYWPRAQSVKLT